LADSVTYDCSSGVSEMKQSEIELNRRLTKACTGARSVSVIEKASYPAPGDASR
jgi:hypothetical protein